MAILVKRGLILPLREIRGESAALFEHRIYPKTGSQPRLRGAMLFGPMLYFGSFFTPPILQTSFHSSAVTGWTERRDSFTSAMSLRPGSAFTSARVTGFGIGATAATS